MRIPKILVMAGSVRDGSTNARLAALAAKEFALAEAEVTRISLAEYPLPLFDADFATDANAAYGAGIPAITVGVTTGGNAHRLDEYIDLPPIGDGLAALEALAEELAGG